MFSCVEEALVAKTRYIRGGFANIALLLNTKTLRNSRRASILHHQSESKVKVENAKRRSTIKVSNSSGRVGEVGSIGTEDHSKSKKVEIPNGELDTAWTEKDFIITIDYVAKECLLPNDGVMQRDIMKALVSDEEVEKCFGPKSGNKGRNGPKLNNCVGLPQSEVLHLFQVIDSHALGATFPRALYVERFLKNRINWDCLDEAPQNSSVILELTTVKLASLASYMPGFIELKDDIAVRKKLTAKLRDDIAALTEAIVGFRRDLNLANKSIAKVESKYKVENAN
ncbi:hypothetical protein R1sor_002130 [Riccia sorocarpa]|uniref:Uncharacterized protein n=1 Tax=Riccia sorocarpa TaxID=122646 RepID=A0ABD3GXX5_9MARC